MTNTFARHATPAIPGDQTLELVRLATLAPSGHNTQPWRFDVRDDRVRLLPDLSRRLPVVDPDDHALFVSLGAAFENLVIAAGRDGLRVEEEAFPPADPDALVARLSPGPGGAEPELAAAILERQSTRRLYEDRPIPAGHLRELERAAARNGVLLLLFTGRREIEALVPFVEEGSRAQFEDPLFLDELVSWIRFGRREASGRPDGLTAAAMGLPPVPRWAGELVMKRLLSGASEARRTAKQVRSSSALALFVASRNDRRGWVDVGRSFERLALAATARGIRHAHVNMPCEVVEVRRRLAAHLRFGDAHPLLLLRLGYGAPMPRSPRRPLADVLA